ncbi:MAG: hypothetical protein FWG90_09360 [Oscillospiraceae bacterium]|nr:hypothetical protein [Oscillospiraceae bacterium]
MPISEAQKRAKIKYDSKTYKRFSANIKNADYELIDNYCKENNISKPKLLVNAFKYCVENNANLNLGVENNASIRSKKTC